MRATQSIQHLTRGLLLLGTLVLATVGTARAQDGIQPGETSASAWQHYDWLSADGGQQKQTVETVKSSVTQDVSDPFTVVSSGTLWQEKYGAVDTKRLDDTLLLSCETSSIDLYDGSDDLSRSQKVGLEFQPVQEFILRADLHDAASDAPMPGQSTTTSGTAISAEGHLPMNAVLTLGAHTDYTAYDEPSLPGSQTTAYDAQFRQPLGSLPLSAILKGHYEGTSVGGAAPTSLPSLEQSLEWKPLTNTTLQAGLRQQQYQEYPGVDHELNEALFADWQQKIVDDVSWHSYAEILNSKGLLDTAPAAAISSGANGTAQQNNPANNGSLTSSLPVSVDNQTLTFSTGPSFKLQQDISASVEYSDRWDSNPATGTSGQEQRVSVSVKGSF